ncbi:50S ribosomal protein L22 [Candidatus Poribacteria bacterium]|jgi:large subunit ribosomal protein L22|nr:50S ribosomal protein L22 [Candidatus Poribacteria bacterium]
MVARASIKNVAVAPRKARLVVDLVRGHYVEDALDQLAFTNKAVSPVLHKLIRSAIANAQYVQSSINEQDLFIKRIWVDEGITRRWIRPRARGMAHRILRRKCHITVELDIDSDLAGEPSESTT